MKFKDKSLFFVILISVILAILNIRQVLLPLGKVPEETVYLASGMFAADYWGYLSSVAQGYQGSWSLRNPFTSESTKSYHFVNWPYLLIGHISRLLSLSPQVGYWLATAVLTAVFVYFVFNLIEKILRERKHLVWPVFLIYIFSGPFWRLKSFSLRAVEFKEVSWYYRAVFFERISVIIHHLFSNLIVIFLFILLIDFFKLVVNGKEVKRGIWLKITLLFLLLMSTLPLKVTFLLPALAIVFLKEIKISLHKEDLKRFFYFSVRFLILFIILLLFGLLARWDLSGLYFPELKEWERWALEYPPFFQFLSASGPVFILGILGFIYLIFKKVKFSPALLMGCLATGLSYLLFYTKFSLFFDNHNSRFLFSESYLFLSLSLVLAFDSWQGQKKQGEKWLWLVTIVLVIYGSVCWPKAFIDREWPNPNKYFPDYFQFLPKKIAEGFSYLEKDFPGEKIVLVAPDPGLANLVPLFSYSKVFVARKLGTINFQDKFVQVKNFYYFPEPANKKTNFLKKEKITHVVWTTYDFLPEYEKTLDYQNPPFLVAGVPLELIFANSEIKVYAVR